MSCRLVRPHRNHQRLDALVRRHSHFVRSVVRREVAQRTATCILHALARPVRPHRRHNRLNNPSRRQRRHSLVLFL